MEEGAVKNEVKEFLIVVSAGIPLCILAKVVLVLAMGI